MMRTRLPTKPGIPGRPLNTVFGLVGGVNSLKIHLVANPTKVGNKMENGGHRFDRRRNGSRLARQKNTTK
jgi:hypothetical protein